MKQSSKERYLAQKPSRGRPVSVVAQGKKPLAPFEKLVLGLVFVFLIASPLAFLVNKEIMIYVGLINYLILGLAIAVKPEFVTDVMRKNRLNFDEVYGKKLKSLSLTIRGFGVILVGVGVAVFYFIFLNQTP